MRKTIVSMLAVMSVAAASEASAQSFPFNRNVTLKVGQSIVLKGVRGASCGQPPGGWRSVAGQLPQTAIGRYSDGGVGTVESSFCRGTTPARGVRFTATKPGSESLVIFGDQISVNVQ